MSESVAATVVDLDFRQLDETVYIALIERAHQFVETVEEGDLTPIRRRKIVAMLDDMKRLVSP